MDISTSLLALIFLLATNAFFVAAEFALVKSRGLRIEAPAEHGGSQVTLTARIQKDLEAHLAACQLGITMASLGLGWVGASIVVAILEPVVAWVDLPNETVQTVAILIGFLIFCSLHFVVGEQVPKALAIRKPESISLAVAYPLHWVYLVLVPLIWLLNQASALLLRTFATKEAAHSEIPSAEEVRGGAGASGERGEIEQDQVQVLDELSEFDQCEVGRVMTPRESMHVLDASSSSAFNMKVIGDTGHSCFPLVDSADDNAIKGTVLVKDIYSALQKDAKKSWVDLAHLARDPVVVPITERVAELFDMMRARRVHMALVVDEYGGLVGLVTLEDLLDEIVGEIHDETDHEKEEPVIKEIGRNLWEADGLIPLSDLQHVTGYSEPDDLQANTLSGLFLRKLSRMPRVGDHIEDGNLGATVLSLSGQRIGRVSIEILGASDGEAEKQ